MDVILSIKPAFADRIFDGTKLYEYRRSIFKQDVKRVVVYASSPVCKVIGEFEIEEVLCDGIDDLWIRTRSHAGITEEHFYWYFGDRSRGYAIRIGKTMKYETPHCLRSMYGLLPPQSFAYLQFRVTPPIT